MLYWVEKIFLYNALSNWCYMSMVRISFSIFIMTKRESKIERCALFVEKGFLEAKEMKTFYVQNELYILYFVLATCPFLGLSNIQSVISWICFILQTYFSGTFWTRENWVSSNMPETERWFVGSVQCASQGRATALARKSSESRSSQGNLGSKRTSLLKITCII